MRMCEQKTYSLELSEEEARTLHWLVADSVRPERSPGLEAGVRRFLESLETTLAVVVKR